jgi:hypothetical protein
MAAKLGANDAAFRLGDQAVSVYLGAVEVYSASATLYFDGAVDSDWDELGNWWLDDQHTVAATSLPTSADSVVATASITAGGQTVVDFTMFGNFINIAGTLTVTGNATFNGASRNDGTIIGDVTFNDASFNEPTGTVTGNATFNGESGNNGTVTGNATFNDDAINASNGTVTGDATFSGAAALDEESSDAISSNDGEITGNATFNAFSANTGTVAGTATFNSNSENGGLVSAAEFRGTANHFGSVDQDADFYDSSVFNEGDVGGTATFFDSACYISGTAGTFVPDPPPACE